MLTTRIFFHNVFQRFYHYLLQTCSQNKPWCLRPWDRRILKTLKEKEKMLDTSILSFPCFLACEGQFLFVESHLFCRLHVSSDWRGPKFCRLVELKSGLRCKGLKDNSLGEKLIIFSPKLNISLNDIAKYFFYLKIINSKVGDVHT